MELNRIEERLSKVATLVKQWRESGSVPSIERDLALEELRRIYDELLDTPRESVAEVVESVAAASAGEVFDDVLDIDALLGLSDDDQEEYSEEETPAELVADVIPEPEPAPEPELVVEEEPVFEPEPIVEEEPIVEPEPFVESVEVAEQPQPTVGGGLFDIEDIPVRSKAGRKMISLYNTPSAVAESQRAVERPVDRVEQPVPAIVAPEVVAPKVESKVEAEQPMRLADVLASGVTVLGDKMAAAEEVTAPFHRIDDLHKAIGLNDKFLMIRDLFDGNADKYEDTINTLNEFEDLDECMIYIVENFAWNPDLEGAKLLVSLIERKLA